ncbi:MAG: FAD-binding oxidoreductase, partial [Proteobacteria bacterium]|nr:FAD-binding oxidoreductase [Pseudomonadota bacterium]
MNRRDFLKLLALLAVSTYLGSSTSTKKDRIVIVGAGIVGSALGYELAKAGANVTLIDKAQPGSQASGNSFSWINATYPKQPYAYNFFSQLGIDAYKSLAPELNFQIKWSGSLEWFANKQIETDSFKQLANIMRYKQYTPVEVISASDANQ